MEQTHHLDADTKQTNNPVRRDSNVTENSKKSMSVAKDSETLKSPRRYICDRNIALSLVLCVCRSANYQGRYVEDHHVSTSSSSPRNRVFTDPVDIVASFIHRVLDPQSDYANINMPMTIKDFYDWAQSHIDAVIHQINDTR